MTEREYIDTTDLAYIRTIKQCLRQIVAENSDGAILKDDYFVVYGLLTQWEDKLSTRVTTE